MVTTSEGGDTEFPHPITGRSPYILFRLRSPGRAPRREKTAPHVHKRIQTWSEREREAIKMGIDI